jgi:chaperonin GroES
MAKVSIKPIGDRVLVQHIEEKEQVRGGIIIPDSAKEKPQEAKVIALGTGKRDENGKVTAFEVKVGDKVLISKYGGTEVKIDDQKLPRPGTTSSASLPIALPLKTNSKLTYYGSQTTPVRRQLVRSCSAASGSPRSRSGPRAGTRHRKKFGSPTVTNGVTVARNRAPDPYEWARRWSRRLQDLRQRR